MLSTQWGLGCWVRAPGFPETAILPLPWPCREGPRDTDPHPHPPPIPPQLLTLLPGSTDRSVRPRKTSLGAAPAPELLSSGVTHVMPTMNKSMELMWADPGHEAGGRLRLSI